MLGRAYFLTEKKRIGFWFTDKHDLVNYQTTKSEFKKGISRIP